MTRAVPAFSVEDLAEYAGRWPDEAATVELFAELLGDAGNPFQRERLAGHFTASCWLVDRSGERILLTHHKKLGFWLQLGGHADGERDLRVGGQRGMAAGERQAQQFVVGLPARFPGVRFVGPARPVRHVKRGTVTRAAGRLSSGHGDRPCFRSGQERQLARAYPVATQPVQRLAAGRGRQPAARVRGDAVARPVLDRLDERVLHRVLGQADVAGTRGEGGPDPGRFIPVGALKRLQSGIHVPSVAGTKGFCAAPQVPVRQA